MVMILDLNPLPYVLAFKIIEWCWDHDIDREACLRLIHARTVTPVPDIKWELDVPDKYITFFILKWGNYFQSHDVAIEL
jgi:hypothetical protein